MNKYHRYITAGVTALMCTVSAWASDIESPTVDATTMAEQQAPAQKKPVHHHWYDGPITATASPDQTTTHSSVATDNVVQGESQLTLPAVTSAESARDTTPTVAATQASTLAPETKELPPVESLTSEPSPVNTASSSPSTQQPTSTYRPPVTQAALPARSSSVTAIPAMNNAHLSDAQQIARLQQQMQNMVAMNMPQQIADLQQQVQTLTGQLAESQHAVQVLQQQQTDFYKDMDQRIAALKKSTPIESSATAAAQSGVITVTAGVDEASVYGKASELLTKKDYDGARHAYESYLTQFPQGTYAANAHYWLGELSLVNKDQASAMASFNTVVNDFSSSSKVPDAQYKIALIQMNQGQLAVAKKGFNAIQKQYPKSTAAQLAHIKVQQIEVKQSG